MQITTTAIKNKRYSTYGWNVKENNGVYKNTLSQGEIGVLLGHKYTDDDGHVKFKTVVTEEDRNLNLDLNTVLEVRIGNQDNQYFFDAALLGREDGTDQSVKQVDSLPSFGNIHTIYIVKSTNISYRWDEDLMRMVPLSGSGGNLDPFNYYNKQETESLIEEKMQSIKAIDGGDSIGNPSLLNIL